MTFRNTYEDARYAAAYAAMRFPNTYFLAFRDLPDITRRHVRGRCALDFGCGAGRSTRFLRDLGFETIGVDISPDMIREARQIDPGGAYRLIDEQERGSLREASFGLILSAFTFDNIPTIEKKVSLLGWLRSMLAAEGRIVNLVSSPEIYRHEWGSFSTKAFPENHRARNGDVVRIVVTDLDDPRPAVDVLWDAEAYAETYRRAELTVEATYRPLARADDPGHWVNETRIPPWTIDVLMAS